MPCDLTSSRYRLLFACLLTVVVVFTLSPVLAAAPLRLGIPLIDLAEGAALDAEAMVFYIGIVIIIGTGVYCWATERNVLMGVGIAAMVVVIASNARRIMSIIT